MDPNLVQIENTYGAQGFHVVSNYMYAPQYSASIQGHVTSAGINFFVGMNAAAGSLYGINMYPTVYVIDPQGEVVRSASSFLPSSTEIQAYIATLQNLPPAVNASASAATAAGGAAITLTATATDPESDTLTYLWTQTSGNAAANIASPAGASTSVVLPAVTATETLDFEILVSDGNGGAVVAVVSVGVYGASSPPVNQLPIVSTSAAQSVISEGSTVVLSVFASDPDGDSLTFAWSAVSGPPVAFSVVDEATTEFLAPDVDADTTLVLRITVSDGVGTPVSADITVTVVNSPAPIAPGFPQLQAASSGCSVSTHSGWLALLAFGCMLILGLSARRKTAIEP